MVWEVIWNVLDEYRSNVEDCLDGVGRLSGGYGEAVWRVLRVCMEGVGRVCFFNIYITR